MDMAVKAEGCHSNNYGKNQGGRLSKCAQTAISQMLQIVRLDNQVQIWELLAFFCVVCKIDTISSHLYFMPCDVLNGPGSSQNEICSTGTAPLLAG